jgi:deazaflavin-dependent oxidoreductase (nitroreductase family)
VTLPHWLGRFNKVVTNRVQGTYAWLIPGWVVICHRGRKSGRLYRTPVNAYKEGDSLAVVLVYGERTDWLRNVLAGDAQVVRTGRTHALVNPRLVGPDEVSNPRARAVARLTDNKVLLAELGEPSKDFGRGPRAD